VFNPTVLGEVLGELLVSLGPDQAVMGYEQGGEARGSGVNCKNAIM
jgi:hypothetical protein